MAWTPLKENYTDAVWSGLRKYTEVQNADGTVSFNDVTVYSQKENSFFGASDANATNAAINIIMAMVENGTDLYTDFQTYFATQKTVFQNKANAQYSEYETYISNLEKQADAELTAIETGYAARMANYESTQQALFNQWFDYIKGQLTDDVAGHLQEQCTELDSRLSQLEYMTLQNDFTVPISVDSTGTTLLVDDSGNAIVADWKYKEE